MAYTSLPDIGGAEFLTHNLANTLISHGVDVTVLGTKDFHFSPKKDLKKFKYRYKFVIRKFLPKRFFFKAWFQIIVISHILFNKYDIINCIYIYPSAILAIRALKKINKNIPVVGTAVGIDIQISKELNYGFTLKKGIHELLTKYINDISYLVIISKSMYADSDRLKIAKKKIIYIPVGSELKPYMGNRMELKRRYGINSNVPLFLLVGRNIKKKNYISYILAVRKVIDKGYGFQSFIIGRETYRLEDEILNLGLSDYIKTNEEVLYDDYKNFYCMADVYVSVSFVEGNSLALADAVAAGLPILISNSPGTSDYIEYGTGLFVNPIDIDSIANSIIKMLSDTNRKFFIEKALSVSNRLSWDAIGGEYIKVYKSLMGKENDF